MVRLYDPEGLFQSKQFCDSMILLRGKENEHFLWVQMQEYMLQGSDVDSEELNHRITKKCTGFPWLKEEIGGRERSRIHVF